MAAGAFGEIVTITADSGSLGKGWCGSELDLVDVELDLGEWGLGGGCWDL